ncbi:ABC transporter permease [Thermoleophilia bacterium SCSIO 60948]|nr:ABC transporter permease [Thermoleophilia bacterium SCSIO 60948]
MAASHDVTTSPQTGGSGVSLDPTAEVAAAEGASAAGLGPWKLAWRRLRRDKAALFFGGVFLALVLACVVLAPIWSNSIAERTPNEQPSSSDTVTVDGEEVGIIGAFDSANPGVPIGPTWGSEYFLGADSGGRDVMVRLLYGGRNSLIIGILAAFFTTIVGVLLGIAAGFMRGKVDTIISRLLDVIWAFPVILLGVALGTALASDGLQIGPLVLASGSLAIPIFIIAIVYVPYLARPIRGQVLSLRESEFVEAARAQGMGSGRIMLREVLPNVLSTILVFFPLLIANAILLEAALSFLGAGIQPPDPSWGSMIDDGVDRVATAPYLAIVPGAMLVLTVLSLNIFGDGVRDALDPRAKVRLDH